MKKSVNRLQRSENIAGWCFVMPALIVFLSLTLLPFFISLVLSFLDWNFLKADDYPKFVGFQHFYDIFFNTAGNTFLRSFGNTLVYVITIVPMSIIMSLVFAYCMNGRIFGKKALRMMFFAPYICSLVAVGAVFRQLFGGTGPVNQLLQALHLIKEPINWSVDDRYTKIPVILLSVWSSIGYQLILFTAAMQNVPTSLYEAAKIDGAGGLRRFISITLPMISPTIFYLVITRMIAVFKIFGSVNILTMGTSMKSNRSLVVEIYNEAFQAPYNFGGGSAMSLILFVTIIFITAINFWGQKKWVHY